MGNQIPTGTPPVQGIADPLKVVTKLVITSPEKCLKKQPKIDIPFKSLKTLKVPENPPKTIGYLEIP